MQSALSRFDWKQLAARLEGSLVLPDDPEYAWARKRFIAHSEDVLPQAVARCGASEDVAEAITFARSKEVHFALRSGGHSYADHSSTGGLLIDLRDLDSITVDGDAAVVGPGATTGAVAERLARFGRVLPSGSWPTVGIGGIALVGGYGFLSRMYGLTTDHLLSAEVVLADGSLTTADATNSPDLYWALRGAGAGNLAAVTSLLFRTHQSRPSTSFHCVWPSSHAVAAIDAWQRWAPNLAFEVSAELEIVAPDLDTETSTIELFGVSLLDRESTAQLLIDFASSIGARAARAYVENLGGRDAARYQVGLVTRTNDAACIPAGPFMRPGFQFVKSEFFDEPLPIEAITALVRHVSVSRSYGERRTLEFVPWRGAQALVPPDASAFVHRKPLFLLKHGVLLGSSASAERRKNARSWIRTAWATTHPYGSDRAYQGFPDPDLVNSAEAYYGTNLPRLKRVKATYDPENVFTSDLGDTLEPAF